MTNPEYCQVVTATDSREQADELARTAVEARLAAAAQVVGPIHSTYWWKDRLESAEEWQVVFKTTFERYADLEAHIRARHRYELPGIVCMPFIAGYPPYLEWLATETRLSADRSGDMHE